mmetsp:Transcript_33979/g.74738  ORF Transcript_33979/g.74738 Transcript_33979/m.74738 type:complete len:123 (-) Transcript_33979:74-442(-)
MDGAVGISRDDTSAVDSVVACRCRKSRRVSSDNAVSVLLVVVVVVVQDLVLAPRQLHLLLLLRLLIRLLLLLPLLPHPIDDGQDTTAGGANPSAGENITDADSTDRAATSAASAVSFVLRLT